MYIFLFCFPVQLVVHYLHRSTYYTCCGAPVGGCDCRGPTPQLESFPATSTSENPSLVVTGPRGGAINVTRGGTVVFFVVRGAYQWLEETHSLAPLSPSKASVLPPSLPARPLSCPPLSQRGLCSVVTLLTCCV